MVILYSVVSRCLLLVRGPTAMSNEKSRMVDARMGVAPSCSLAAIGAIDSEEGPTVGDRVF